MLKILQVRLQQYVNQYFQMFKLDLEKAEEPEINLPAFVGSLKKTREFQKNIYFCCINYTKAFDCVDDHKLWNILFLCHLSFRIGMKIDLFQSCGHC